MHAIGNADLPKDVREVRLDRLLADPEPPRDQLVRHPVKQKREHLALSGRDPGERVGRILRIEERARGARVERRAARGRRPNALDDLLRRGVLQ